MTGDEIGYAWLAVNYKVQPVQPFAVESRIGPGRRTWQEGGRRLEYYTEAMRPPASLGAHLTFALKHEGVALEYGGHAVFLPPSLRAATHPARLHGRFPDMCPERPG